MNNELFQTPFWGVAVVALAVLTGCDKVPDVASNVASPTTTAANAVNVPDADVTTNVKTALRQDAALQQFNISVATIKGDVRLTGVVDMQSQIDAALKLARGAEGVHAIHDELTLKK